MGLLLGCFGSTEGILCFLNSRNIWLVMIQSEWVWGLNHYLYGDEHYCLSVALNVVSFAERNTKVLCVSLFPSSISIFYFLLCLSIKIVLSLLFWDPSLTFSCVCQRRPKHKVTHKSFKRKVCPVVDLAANTAFTSIWKRDLIGDLRAGSSGLIGSCVELVYVELCLWHKLLCLIGRDRHENRLILHKS